MSKKRALISVHDKTGVVELARELANMNYDIVSTGGTYNLLIENGINAIEVKEVTDYEEMLEGRVKTLHPTIFAGILARQNNPNDMLELEKANIETINLVVVGLYPFAKARTVEMIDIGGVSLIRAAAKNHKYVDLLTSPDEYENYLNIIKENGSTSFEYRKNVAIEAFKLTSQYDALIAQTFEGDING